MTPWDWLCATEGFVPRSKCGPAWTPLLIAACNTFDLTIALSYCLIPCGILRAYRKIRAGQPIPRAKVGVLLGANFVFWCGMTHLTERVMFFWPAYHLDCAVRGLCAAASFASVLWFSMLDLEIQGGSGGG